MRNLRVKAASTSGETLVETLAAVLVSAFGLLMLAVAVSVAVSIVSGIDKTADEYYAATDALVAGTADKTGAGTVAVTVSNADFTGGSVNITYAADTLPGNVTAVTYQEQDPEAGA